MGKLNYGLELRCVWSLARGLHYMPQPSICQSGLEAQLVIGVKLLHLVTKYDMIYSLIDRISDDYLFCAALIGFEIVELWSRGTADSVHRQSGRA